MQVFVARCELTNSNETKTKTKTTWRDKTSKKVVYQDIFNADVHDPLQ